MVGIFSSQIFLPFFVFVSLTFVRFVFFVVYHH